MGSSLVERYIELGLRLGRHVDGFVDAYYGPPEIAARVDADELGPDRRHWLRGQTVGLRTSARKLAGEPIGYLDEVEWCYGARPSLVPEDEFALAHERLDAVLPGSGALRDRVIAWRESHAVPPDTLPRAIESLAEDLRSRTVERFGLPEGERIDWILETDKPWSGFNYYEGGLHSRVAINVDLPVLSLTLGHLVAHEAYPGHHTEHSRKEAGLVRRRRWLEETISPVGTPQCTMSEGLADLGLEVVVGRSPVAEEFSSSHLRPLGVTYDAEVAASFNRSAEALAWVRSNAAIMLHEQAMGADDVVAYLERWSLLPHTRATKAVSFLTDPTWRAYSHCYTEGLRLCRAWVDGSAERFERLVTDQFLPSDLV